MAAISSVNDLRDTAGPASGMYLYGLSARLPWLLGIPVALVAAVALAATIRRSEAPR
jgi:DHA1 family tetracycline resistance protein-like MFS transporter